MFHRKMKMNGICKKCPLNNSSYMPLSQAKQGVKLVIMEMRAGRAAHLKLTSLGLRPGDTIEVISSNYGKLVVAHNNTRIALGRGIAEKIMVDFYNHKVKPYGLS